MTKNTHLNLSNAKGIYHIAVTDISYIQANGACSATYTENGDKITCCKNLAAITRDLKNNDDFIRVHRSYIVNKKQVRMYKKEDGGKILMNDGTEILVAKRRKKEFISQLRK